jgi:hypothetical protein
MRTSLGTPRAGALLFCGMPLEHEVTGRRLNDDGSLEGAWTIADKDGVGEEILTPMK